jgi:hypothetical protein
MLSSKVIACKDCKHSVPADFGSPRWFVWLLGGSKESWNFAKCNLSVRVKTKTDWGNGTTKIEKDIMWCTIEREFGECGAEAKKFEPRVPED